MKKLILLTIITLSNLIAFSQNGTVNSTDSVVTLPKLVAINVVKDIIRKDSCELELTLIKENNELLSDNIRLKDSIIINQSHIIDLHKKEEINLNNIIELKDVQKTNLEGAVNTLRKEIKNTKKKLVKTQIGASMVIIFLSYLLIK